MKKKKIIVISGKQYSGKETLAKILLEFLPQFKRIGIGDAIKIQYGKENNLTFEEIEKEKHLYRDDLIKLGNKGRAIDKNYWLKNLVNLDNIIVPDLRVEDEVDFFKKQGAFLIRVESSYESRSSRGVIVNNDDHTEIALDNYKDWNLIIENNSDFETFKTKTKEVLNELKNFFNIN